LSFAALWALANLFFSDSQAGHQRVKEINDRLRKETLHRKRWLSWIAAKRAKERIGAARRPTERGSGRDRDSIGG
jgi:hypothetical protein